MNRREILAAVALLLPAAARAQEPGVTHRIAVLAPSQFSVEAIRLAVIPELGRLGYVEGKNLAVSYYVASLDELPRLAAEAVALRPQVVIASTNPAVSAVIAASATTPVVMAFAGEDPVAAGIAKSLARPGGSVTGLTNMATQLDGKRVALLHEAVPMARRIGFLAIPPPRHVASLAEMERVAAELGLVTHTVYAYHSAEYAAAFAALRSAGAQAVATASAPEYLRDASVIARHASEAALPIIGEFANLAREGFFIGFGPDLIAFRRRAAGFVARILQGAAPGDLPIELPTTFELVVNMKTARVLGLTLPASILARADEVIE